MGNQWHIAIRTQLRNQQRYDLGHTNRTPNIICDVHHLGQQLWRFIVRNGQHHHLGRDSKHRLQSFECDHRTRIRYGQYICHYERWYCCLMGNFTFAPIRSFLRQWYDLWAPIDQHERNDLHCLRKQLWRFSIGEFDIDHQRANTEHRLQSGQLHDVQWVIVHNHTSVAR